MTGQGWVEAGSLGIGSSIVSRAGPALSVINVTWKRDKSKELAAGSAAGGYIVYNLTLEDDHTFFAGTTGGRTLVHNTGCDTLDPEKEWRFHYSDQTNLNDIGINPDPGTDRVFITDMPGDYADREILDGLINRPVTHAYPIDVTGLEVEEAGSGYMGASDEFVRGSIEPGKVMPPFVLP